MAKLRFAICGLGCMGRGHFKRLHAHPRAEVVAVCDADPARRRGEWNDALGNMDLVMTREGRAPLDGVAQYATPDEAIADPRVDALVVALPTSLHAEVAVKALEAGKHVLCEKPMARRPAECDRMVRAAETSGRKLMIAQCLRFWPHYETIKRCVDEGRIGAVRFVMMQRVGCPPTYSYGNWMLDAGQSGGAILDLHVHDVDFAHYLLGVPQTIYARGTQGPSTGIDHVVAMYGYPDGRYAVLEGGWTFAAPWPFDMAIWVHGEKGSLDWRMRRGDDVLHYTGAANPEVIPCEGDALQREQDYFIDCVLSGRPVERCSPASTRTSVVLAWLERRSVETGKVVHVEDRLQEAWSD